MNWSQLDATNHSVFFFQIAIACTNVFATIVYRAQVTYMLNQTTVKAYASLIVSITSAVINLIVSLVLSKVYYFVARKLTEAGKLMCDYGRRIVQFISVAFVDRMSQISIPTWWIIYHKNLSFRICELLFLDILYRFSQRTVRTPMVDISDGDMFRFRNYPSSYGEAGVQNFNEQVCLPTQDRNVFAIISSNFSVVQPVV